MKKSYILLSAILFALTTFAQIPNGDLESWDTSLEQPTGWSTSNVFTLIGCPKTVSKVTDRVSGSFAMRLETVAFNNPLTKKPTTAGMAGPGGIDFANESAEGIPFNQKPTNLKGSIKGTIMAGDSAGVIVYFTKYDQITKESDMVGEGFFFIKGTVAEYQVFNAPIDLDVVPDTMVLIVTSSDLDNPKVGSVLFVDNLSFTLPLGIDKSVFELNGSVYPNPCRDMIVFDNLKPEFKVLDILDLNGNSALRVETNDGKVEVNTSILSEGIYVYKWSDNKGIPQRTGKFSVIK